MDTETPTPLILFVLWIAFNLFLSMYGYLEFTMDKSCHSFKRIEYVLPGMQLGCQVGNPINKTIGWIFGDT